MNVTVIRSNRKTAAIQVSPDLSVTVRAPGCVSDKEIRQILQDKEAWINKQVDRMKRKKNEYESRGMEKLTPEEIRELADQALDYIPKRVCYFAKQMGVTYGRITIRNEPFKSFLERGGEGAARLQTTGAMAQKGRNFFSGKKY